MEALKRGACEVIFVEKDPVLCIFIKNTLQKKKLSDKAKVYNLDAVHFLEQSSRAYDIIFADPPYESGELERLFKVFEKKLLVKENGLLILQHYKKKNH